MHTIERNSDAHAVGVQAADGWNYIGGEYHDCGTAVEIWKGSDPKTAHEHIFTSVYMHDTVNRSKVSGLTPGHGIKFGEGTPTGGLRTGCVIQHCRLEDLTACAIDSVSGDGLVIDHNHIDGCGQDPKVGEEDIEGNAISFRGNNAGLHDVVITNNYVANWNGASQTGNSPKAMFLFGGVDGLGDPVPSSGCTVNNNTYAHNTLTASSAGVFRDRARASEVDANFTTWVATSGWDADSTWET